MRQLAAQVRPRSAGEDGAAGDLLSDWPVLVNVLTSKAEYVLDDEERASLAGGVWARRSATCSKIEGGAIAAYERALELDGESAFTVDCLIDLRERSGEPGILVELYQRRVELSSEDDADLKYTLLLAAAKTYEELSDRRKAIDLLGQALGVRPSDPDVLDALDRLYREKRKIGRSSWTTCVWAPAEPSPPRSARGCGAGWARSCRRKLSVRRRSRSLPAGARRGPERHRDGDPRLRARQEHEDLRGTVT
ncbi:MAG: hypothetical protein U0263_40705 [Polyangiaceae bacterium]